MNKIASLVSYKITPPISGGQKGIFFFLTYLAQCADITCFTVTENKDAPKINFLSLLGSSKNAIRYFNPLLYYRIKNICIAKGITAIILEHPYYAWLGFLLKRFAGLKVIIHSHNIEAERFKSMKKWWWKIMFYYERFAHQMADCNFFITDEDRQYAIRAYKLEAKKCAVITYGTTLTGVPSAFEKEKAKEKICSALKIPPSTKLLLFNGSLNYIPNSNGLDRILHIINPFLINNCRMPYKIIICGPGLKIEYKNLKAYENQHIIYTGFVDDIDLYFKAADVFLNPIIDGGGIKTKLVEALAADLDAVSFATGAYGIPTSITNNKLTLVPDEDDLGFAVAVMTKFEAPHQSISPAFFSHFSWHAIAQKADAIISSLK